MSVQARSQRWMSAEALWEMIGADYCLCVGNNVVHWCERCQQRIDSIAAFLSGYGDRLQSEAATQQQKIASIEASLAEKEKELNEERLAVIEVIARKERAMYYEAHALSQVAALTASLAQERQENERLRRFCDELHRAQERFLKSTDAQLAQENEKLRQALTTVSAIVDDFEGPLSDEIRAVLASPAVPAPERANDDA